jgi:WD40 repeat protein
LLFTPGGDGLIASGGSNSDGRRGTGVRVWDTHTWQERFTLAGAGPALALSRDGKVLAAAERDEGDAATVRLRDPRTGHLLRSLPERALAISFLALSPDGGVLACVSLETLARQRFTLYDLTGGREPVAVSLPEDRRIESLTFAPDGHTVAGGCSDGTARLWDAVTGQERLVLAGHRPPVRLAFAPDDNTLATGGHNDGKIRLWDATPPPGR